MNTLPESQIPQLEAEKNPIYENLKYYNTYL